MAPRGSTEDPKVAALREARCLNPHPGQVTDPAFLAEEFFDARDAVQVKYEMVRRVTVDGAPVTATAAAFGYSRPAYYQAAAAPGRVSGLDGLVPARPGPRGGHKLTERDPRLGRAAAGRRSRTPARAAWPGPSPPSLRRARAPPVGRASAGPPPGAPLQKPLTCPPARTGRRSTRPCPCDPHLAPRLLNRAPARMPARLAPPAAGWMPATSNCAMPPCTHARGVPARARRAHRKGRHRLAARPGQPGPPPPGSTQRGAGRPAAGPQPPGHRLPAPVAAELISALAAVALAGNQSPARPRNRSR